MGALEGPRALGPLLLLFNNKTKKKNEGGASSGNISFGGKIVPGAGLAGPSCVQSRRFAGGAGLAEARDGRSRMMPLLLPLLLS